MAPGIASGGGVGISEAFLLKSKAEKLMEPLSRTSPSPHVPRPRGIEVWQTPEAPTITP